jgi:hypothetical protein
VCFKKALDAYTSIPTIIVDGKSYAMTNGIGLGQLNEIVTIASVLIFRVALQKGVLPCGSYGYFFNDDQMVYIPDAAVAEDTKEFMSKYINLYNDAGYTLHPKKGFLGRVGHFCEKFTLNAGPGHRKLTQHANAFLKAILKPEMWLVKQHFSQQWGDDALTEEMQNWLLSKVMSVRGYEFSPDEINWPIDCGGWVRFRNSLYPKLNNFLLFLEKDDCPRIPRTLWYYYKEPKIAYRPWKKKTRFDKDFLSKLLIEDGDPTTMSWNNRVSDLINGGLPSNRRTTYMYRCWNAISKARQKALKHKCPTNHMVCLEIANREYNDVAIPECCLIIGDRYRGLALEHWKFPKQKGDATRLWYYIHGVEDVVPHGCARTTDLWRLFFGNITTDRTNALTEFYKHAIPQGILLSGKIARFTKKPYYCIAEMWSRHCSAFSIVSKNSKSYEYIRDTFGIGVGEYMVPTSCGILRCTDEDILMSRSKEDFYERVLLRLGNSMEMPPSDIPLYIEHTKYELAEMHTKMYRDKILSVYCKREIESEEEVEDDVDLSDLIGPDFFNFGPKEDPDPDKDPGSGDEAPTNLGEMWGNTQHTNVKGISVLNDLFDDIIIGDIDESCTDDKDEAVQSGEEEEVYLPSHEFDDPVEPKGHTPIDDEEESLPFGESLPLWMTKAEDDCPDQPETGDQDDVYDNG